MDIPVNSWELDQEYTINDIVEVGNLALPKGGGARDSDGNIVVPLADDAGAQFIDEAGFGITPPESLSRYPSSGPIEGGVIKFDGAPALKVGECINIDIDSTSIFDVGETTITQKLSPQEFVFSPILSSGSEDSIELPPDFQGIKKCIDSNIVSIETAQGAVIGGASQEIKVGAMFAIDPNLNYSIRSMVKKGTADSATVDPYKTLIKQKSSVENADLSIVDPFNSIGVGVGIKFYEGAGGEVGVSDLRNSHRLMASSELSDTEYYNVQLDIESTDIPPTAIRASLVVFAYGLVGDSTFHFKQIEARNSSPFFYCIADHLSSVDKEPNSAAGSSYWTQDFVWRPAYGSKADFAALNDSLKLGEGSDYISSMALNALPMQLSLTFDNRTDKEVRAIIHFLQEKFFAYESIFSLDYKGNRLLSSDVGHFNFKYTYPYREDLKFICTDFNHTKTFRNNNTVTATFVCKSESILRNAESHAGYNPRVDALIPICLDHKTTFTKGVPIKLNTFSLEEGDGSAITVPGPHVIGPQGEDLGFILFRVGQEPDFLNVGDCINIDIDSTSRFNVGAAIVVGGAGFLGLITFLPISGFGSGSADPVELPPDFQGIKKLIRCPEDCLSSSVRFPPNVSSIKAEVTNPVTGEKHKRQVYLNNYRKLQLDSDIFEGVRTITFTPLETFTMESDEDFYVLIPAVVGRSSIYLKNPDEFVQYPWRKVRDLDFKPSFAFSVPQTPKHLQSNFVEYYNHAYKKGINQNLFTFNVTFDKRSDKEAAEILQFLESHLGYKKFSFQLPRPYAKDQNPTTTPAAPDSSVFYCPSWGHDVVFKNNHTISATFIGSSTHPEVIDDGDGSGFCYGAEVRDPITMHSVCLPSAVIEAAFGAGFSEAPLGENETQVFLDAKPKEVDLIFVVDGSGSCRGKIGVGDLNLLDAVVDLLQKITCSYDDYTAPGTESYEGLFDAPNIKFVDRSGDSNVPPWPVSEATTPPGAASMITPQKEIINTPGSENALNGLLEADGYNLKNLDRFTIKIGQKTVNIGVVYFSSGTKEPVSLLKNSQSYDTPYIFGAVKAISSYGNESTNAQAGIRKAIAQLVNSPRAETVSERFIIITTDGWMDDGDAWLNTVSAMRKNGSLAKRRPSDLTLGQYGASLGSYVRHPDKGADLNPEWYEEQLPTVVTVAAMGVRGSSHSINPSAKQGAFDYDTNPTNPQFYYPITDGGPPASEPARLLGLIQAVEVITQDSGAENIFSVTLKNCGPFDVDLLNTLVSCGQPGPVKYTTELLKGGIPKGRTLSELQYISSSENYHLGYGGQFYGDSKNQNILRSSFADSNVLWESFNTKYEVYRSGNVLNVDGGWMANQAHSKGALNTGVASKNMPVRVFKMDSGVHVIDYNVGAVITSSDGRVLRPGGQARGNYAHLPTLKVGETIDLFFSLRLHQESSAGGDIQLVFNAQDPHGRQLDCYAQVMIPQKKQIFKSTSKLVYEGLAPMSDCCKVQFCLDKIGGTTGVDKEGQPLPTYFGGGNLSSNNYGNVDIAGFVPLFSKYGAKGWGYRHGSGGGAYGQGLRSINHADYDIDGDYAFSVGEGDWPDGIDPLLTTLRTKNAGDLNYLKKHGTAPGKKVFEVPISSFAAARGVRVTIWPEPGFNGEPEFDEEGPFIVSAKDKWYLAPEYGRAHGILDQIQLWINWTFRTFTDTPGGKAYGARFGIGAPGTPNQYRPDSAYSKLFPGAQKKPTIFFLPIAGNAQAKGNMVWPRDYYTMLPIKWGSMKIRCAQKTCPEDWPPVKVDCTWTGSVFGNVEHTLTHGDGREECTTEDGIPVGEVEAWMLTRVVDFSWL